MVEKLKKFEVCIGVGLNQFFPEYITIEVSEEDEEVVETENSEE
jgi:hypothetical protein